MAFQATRIPPMGMPVTWIMPEERAKRRWPANQVVEAPSVIATHLAEADS